jgi:hypothetical protein
MIWYGGNMKRLHTWYKGKLILRVLIPKGGFKVKFEDLLVFSWLTRRKQKGKGLKRTTLAKLVGLDLGHTIPAVVTRLTDLGLVRSDGGLLVAADDPPVATFVYTAAGRPATWPMLILTRSCPLTLKQAAVFSEMHSPNITIGRNSLSRLLRFDRKTVSTALKKFKQMGLLNPVGAPVEPCDKTLTWWVDRLDQGRSKAEGWDSWRKAWQSLITFLCERHPSHDWRSRLEEIKDRAVQAGYDYRWTKALCPRAFARLGQSVPIGNLVLAMPDMIRRAEEDTRRNIASGKFTGKNGYGLFTYMVKAYCAGVKKRTAG